MSKLRYILFTGDSCSACKTLKAKLDKSEIKYPLAEYNIETETGMQKATEHGVMSIPVMIKLNEDEEIDRMIGFDIPSLTRLLK